MMLKQFFLFCAIMIASAAAGGYGYGSRGGGGGGGGGGVGGYGHAPVHNYAPTGPVPVAIQTHHAIKYYDVPVNNLITPASIEVGAQSIPINILFRSSSSSLNIQHYHEGAKGTEQETHSEDEAHMLRHSVTKPIFQEIHEIIKPFRKISQTVQPVHEEIQTLIARGQPSQQPFPNQPYPNQPIPPQPYPNQGPPPQPYASAASNQFGIKIKGGKY